MVILRLHLDQVEADELDVAQSANQPQGVAAARSPDFRRPGARGKAWIHEIDVERQKHGARTDPLAHFRKDIVDAALEELLGRNQMKPERPRSAAVLGTVERATDSELHGSLRLDQAFLDGAFTPGAVGVALAPVAVPGVGVRVEVDQSNRTV